MRLSGGPGEEAFPRSPAGRPREDAPSVAERAPARGLLLVDDDRDFADSLAALLQLEGYDVEVAYGFETTLEVAARRPPQVALVDIRLGHENGVELVRELRRRLPDLIAVMITAYATIEATVGALQAGAYDYLRKPFHTDDLLATLRRCFERQRLQAERERAMSDLHARNQELEDLNARLTRILASVHTLSRADGLNSAARALLTIVLRELAADGGVVYLREGERLTARAAEGEGYVPSIALPVPDDSWLAIGFARSSPVVNMTSGSPPELCSANRARCPGPTLLLSLADGTDVFGLVVVHCHKSPGFTRQDVDIAQILASFGGEVMRAARARIHLAQSETRLRDIVDNSPSAISLTDAVGTPVLSNVRFLEWFPDGIADDRLPLGHTAEIDVVSSQGSPHHLLVTRFSVRDAGCRPIGVGTIATDITDRHLAEERLRHAQRMEAVGQISGGVAHDFNNLLAVVLGNLRLIEAESHDRPELLELIGDALDAARSGVELTGRLLAFGRVQPLHPEVTDIRELVLTMSRLLGRTLGEDIAIQLTLTPDPWHVRVDRSQLEAALLNLAINARDAMAGGGCLRIAVQNASLGDDHVGTDPEVRAGRYVALSVGDNGTGMSAEVRERAVQPFFTTKTAGQGSGLGLSMVYGFVKQSGGHLQIESDPGRGTTVHLYFPALAPVVAEAPPAYTGEAAPDLRGRGELVLLVEDQPQVRLLLRRQLTRLGYRVADVPDAAAAEVRLSEAPKIDLLLTDLVLPGKRSGLQLCEAALARDPALGVILTTGYASEVLAARTGPVADAPVLRKPVEPETLARVLRRVLDSPPGRGERVQSPLAENR